MFNLNIPAASLLSVDGGGGGSLCTTPKTPEIVNTLIAMTNPLDNYTFLTSSALATNTTSTDEQQASQTINQQFASQDSCHSSSSGSAFDSPAGTNSTLSVQQTCSQFIKAGLKITIQNKRKISSCDSSSGTEQSTTASKYNKNNFNSNNNNNNVIKNHRYSKKSGETSEDDIDYHRSSKAGLTPEDEDRRRRRRERNKIAATKCRMKKRERTQNLISESEQLETQNVDLKSQVRNLEIERRKLFDMLQSHNNTCVRPGGFQLPPDLCQSPAYKYLNELGFCDTTTLPTSQQQQQQQQHQQIRSQDHQASSTSQQRTTIPSMSTIKFSRNNGLKQQQQLQQQSSPINVTEFLPNGYCKPSPNSQELGYLNSPVNHQDFTETCLTNASNQIQQQCDIVAINPTTISLQNPNNYIPNCETNKNTTQSSVLHDSVCSSAPATSTNDFVLKHELVDSQSPYTTAQSAERFLFESNCENFDIKHQPILAITAAVTTNNLENNCNTNNILTNSHNNNNNNNNLIDDFHSNLITTPTTVCQTSYDNLLMKNDFLTNDATELLAQFVADTNGDEPEFTDLDSGITSTYNNMTNGGCLA